MTDFASAHVVANDWRDACDQVLQRLPGDWAGQLGFVYISDELASDSDRIIDFLRQHSGIPHWSGCIGMGLCGNGSESYEQAALSVLLTPLPDADFRILGPLQDSPAEWLEATRAWRETTLASVAVVHADPGNAQVPELLNDLAEGLGNGFLVGGIASAEQTPVQIADRATSGGLSGVLLSGQVQISTGLSQGCTLIGHKHEITACQRNIIERIDDRPALDVLKEDIGEILARDLQRIGGYIFSALPVPGSDTGDYLVRNLIGVDPDRGLLAIGDYVSVGSEIQFARRDANTAREDLLRMVKQVRGRLPAPPRGALYHSCLGRGRHLFGDDSAELRLIQEELGDVPLAGFYANGEISHNRLYGYTGVLTLFA